MLLDGKYAIKVLCNINVNLIFQIFDEFQEFSHKIFFSESIKERFYAVIIDHKSRSILYFLRILVRKNFHIIMTKN